MRKSISNNNRCSVCGHLKMAHEDDGTFYVECKVEGCDCQEYEEDEVEDYD